MPTLGSGHESLTGAILADDARFVDDFFETLEQKVDWLSPMRFH